MKTHWFKAYVWRKPTRFNPMEEVAIEATDLDHANTRIKKLFGRTHAGISPRIERIGVWVEDSPCLDTDDIGNAVRYPLPTTL